jgi:glycosyltransferase involved in cell wall biosynthesis
VLDLAFDVGGVREWLQPDVNGFLVPRGDVDLMVEKLTVLLENDQLAREMGLAGQKIVRQYFSRDRVVDEFERVLESAVKVAGC